MAMKKCVLSAPREQMWKHGRRFSLDLLVDMESLLLLVVFSSPHGSPGRQTHNFPARIPVTKHHTAHLPPPNMQYILEEEEKNSKHHAIK
jgi:hypothetical protein